MSDPIMQLNGLRDDASTSDQAEGSNNGERSRKRARNGTGSGSGSTDTISCSECRKRKSKCDREQPCGSCVRRGVAHLCQPDIRRHPPSVIDLRQTVQALQSRLQAVEAFLGSKLDFQLPDPSSWSIQEQQVAAVRRETNALQGSDNGYTEPFPLPSSTGQDETEIAYFLTGTASLRDFDILPEASAQDAASSSQDVLVPRLSTLTGTSTIIQPSRHPPHAWQRQLLTGVLQSVPPASQARKYTNLYFRHQEWQIHAVARTQMLQEIDELESIQSEGRLAEVDPAWLALLFQLMSFGLVTSYTIDEQDYPEDVYETVRTQVQLSQRCLAAADWAEVPSIRVVQTLVVHGWWAQHTDADANLFEASATAGQSSRMRVGVAFLHCQALGLDKLGDKETIMPRLDPALPQEASGYRRQMGLRIWHSFQFLESLSGHVYALPGTFSSADPAVCRDKDLGDDLNVPRVTLEEDPNVVNLYVSLSNVKARRDFLLVKEKGTITFEEADKLESVCVPDLANINKAIMRMSEDLVPPCFGTKKGHIQAIKIIEAAAILRIRRLALKNVSDPFSPSARVYLGRVREAAANLVGLLTSATDYGHRITRKFPMTPLYLLNAAVTLTVALCKETSPAEATLISSLIKDAIRTLTDEGLRSRNSAIKLNSEKAILTLDKLIHFLLYHRGSNVNQEGGSHGHLLELSSKIRQAIKSFSQPTTMPARETPESTSGIVGAASTASLNIPQDYYSNMTPSTYELSAMWGWPPQSYGEAEVGEPMTDFSNWSLLQYLEEDNAST